MSNADVNELSSRVLQDLGNLHDCRITSINWDVSSETVQISINDLYSNFDGLPEYRGVTPFIVIFSGVRSIESNVEAEAGKLRIFEFDMNKGGADFKPVATIKLNPVGVIRIRCDRVIYRTSS